MWLVIVVLVMANGEVKGAISPVKSEKDCLERIEKMVKVAKEHDVVRAYGADCVDAGKQLTWKEPPVTTPPKYEPGA